MADQGGRKGWHGLLMGSPDMPRVILSVHQYGESLGCEGVCLGTAGRQSRPGNGMATWSDMSTVLDLDPTPL